MDLVLICMISLLPCEDLVDTCATFGYTRNEILVWYGFTFGVSHTSLYVRLRCPTYIELGILAIQRAQLQPIR